MGQRRATRSTAKSWEDFLGVFSLQKRKISQQSAQPPRAGPGEGGSSYFILCIQCLCRPSPLGVTQKFFSGGQEKTQRESLTIEA